jgi:hypothetical protein
LIGPSSEDKESSEVNPQPEMINLAISEVIMTNVKEQCINSACNI